MPCAVSAPWLRRKTISLALSCTRSTMLLLSRAIMWKSSRQSRGQTSLQRFAANEEAMKCRNWGVPGKFCLVAWNPYRLSRRRSSEIH